MEKIDTSPGVGKRFSEALKKANVSFENEKLTDDDRYEIEKILDIYAGTVNETLNRYCATAIHMDALKEKKDVNPLQKIILELVKTQERVKEIRAKLERMRNG